MIAAGEAWQQAAGRETDVLRDFGALGLQQLPLNFYPIVAAIFITYFAAAVLSRKSGAYLL
jgi:hypothetical protein